jgi:hypothetical protein
MNSISNLQMFRAIHELLTKMFLSRPQRLRRLVHVLGLDPEDGSIAACAFLPLGNPENANRFTPASANAPNTRAPSPGLFGTSIAKYATFLTMSAISVTSFF